jgi:hypothetical protein
MRFEGAVRGSAAFLAVATFVLSCLYTLPSPYFLDSFGYVSWIEAWHRSGSVTSHYRYANTLLYYLPVVLFGEYGLKLVAVAVNTAFAVAYFAMIRRDFSPSAALGASLILLSAPPTVISATHLKEDLTSLLFFSLAVLLVRSRAGFFRVTAAGVAYGLSLLFKEVMLGAAPFAVAYIHLRGADVRRYRDLLATRKLRSTAPRALVFLVAATAVVFTVSPTRLDDYTTMASSPYMGQFFGLFSARQEVGLAFWAEALLYLHPWYLFAVSFFAFDLRDRPPIQSLYLAVAVALLFFLANVSVVRMRHYAPVVFFGAPVFFEGIRAMLEVGTELLRLRRWRPSWSAAIALAVCATTAVFHLRYVYPTIDYRLRYAPARGFFGPLAELLPADALLLGMDNCPIAQYESGLDCENHPPDLDRAAAHDYAEVIADMAARRPLYLLPDFYDYDGRGEMRRALASWPQARIVYTGWWEPYHTMTYGLSVDEAIADRLRRNPSCTLVGRRSHPVRVSERLELDEVEVRLRCGEREVSWAWTAHRGHLTSLARHSVEAVEAP